MGMAAQSAEVMRLRTQIGQMQRRTAHADALSVPEALAPLFPSGGLRPGAAYALADSPSLLFALAGRSSREGSWCAFIGMPDLSLEAAEGYGVAPGRVALIPAPGERWLQAVSSAAEVFPLVAVRPPRAASSAEAARLGARLRDRGCALLVVGPWEGAEASLSNRPPAGGGWGRGPGLISSRPVPFASGGGAAPRPRRVRVLLPGPSGGAEAHGAGTVAGRPHLVAVGA
ncbi:MAG: hypothetical protein ACTIJN_08330 [Microbacterium gubbeenense]|uniref:hypothetical protein n=1 Tax=Microbacterium gubbeenense TaxID=159896 RepID=UPI003F995C2A